MPGVPFEYLKGQEEKENEDSGRVRKVKYKQEYEIPSTTIHLYMKHLMETQKQNIRTHTRKTDKVNVVERGGPTTWPSKT
jgi:hypothetical protein